MNTTLPNEEPIFEASLTPHRSLSIKGFKIFAIITGVMTFAHIVVFMFAKAWPVVLFFGLDFALLLGAFWLSYRSGRAREEVSLSRVALNIAKVAPSGVRQEQQYNPLWTKFDVARHPEIGITHMKVTGQGRNTNIGHFLNPEDRETFAFEFKGALNRAKSR